MNFIGVCVRDSGGIGNDLSFGLIGFLIKPVRHKEKEGHACGARAPFWRSGFVGFLLLTIFFGSPGPVFAQTVSSNCDNATADDPIHCVIDGDEGETGDVSIDIENINVTAQETGVAGKILNRAGTSGHVTIEVNGGGIDVTGNNIQASIAFSMPMAGCSLTSRTSTSRPTALRPPASAAHHQGEGDVVIRVRGGSITADGHPTSGGVNAVQDGAGDGNVDVRITDVDIETGDGGGISGGPSGKG